MCAQKPLEGCEEVFVRTWLAVSMDRTKEGDQWVGQGQAGEGEGELRWGGRVGPVSGSAPS